MRYLQGAVVGGLVIFGLHHFNNALIFRQHGLEFLESSDSTHPRDQLPGGTRVRTAGGQRVTNAIAFAASCPGLERMPQEGARLATSLKGWRAALKAVHETGPFESPLALAAYRTGMSILAALMETA